MSEKTEFEICIALVFIMGLAMAIFWFYFV